MEVYWRLGLLLTIGTFCCISRGHAKALSDFQCPEHKFKCTNEKCVPNIWKCDGDDDCGDGSDESQCVPATCRPIVEFACANSKCIPKRWRCDSESDCADGSDELNCPTPTCKANFFTCNNTRCVPNRWKCDKQDDCGDKSDELNCGVTTASCQPDEFRCTDGTCIIGKWKCDGDKDCADGVDEKNCSTKAPVVCTDVEYRCQNGQCIPKDWRCDGNHDCFDHSDEAGCASKTLAKTCGPIFWQCANGDCIKKDWKCDGEDDCVDGSDEKTCNVTVCQQGKFACRDGHQCITAALRCNGVKNCRDGTDEQHCVTSKINCTKNDFNCSVSECVTFDQVCNGRRDCLGGEDEPHNCNINECLDKNGHCSHICTDQKISYKCSCPKGYELDTDKRTCKDLDECKIFGSCHQTCENLKGHYKCSCAPGYLLEPDFKTCKPTGDKEWVYFSNRVDIRKISPDGKDYRVVVGGLRGVVSLDFHIRKNQLYWTDILTDRIERIKLGSDYNVSAQIIRSNVHTSDGLAVDWINDKLYWTDTGYKTIEVSQLDGSHNMDVVNVGLTEPRAIALDPHAGFIYWTDWGASAAIEKISMDGEINTRKILVDKNLFWPNGLTLDLIQQKLYWIDAKLQRAEAINLDGSDRRVIKGTGFYHPFALDNFNDQLYWTDWKSDRLSSVSKFDTSSVNTIKDGLFAPMGIKVYHQSRQTPGVNRCAGKHGCSHLCLLANHGGIPTFSCKCPRSMVLKEGKTCVGTPRPRTARPPTPGTVNPSQSTVKTVTNKAVTTPPITVYAAKAAKKVTASSNVSVGTIVAIVLSVLVAIGLIVLLFFYVRRRNLSKGNVMYYKDMSSTPLEDDFDIEQDDVDDKAKIVSEYDS